MERASGIGGVFWRADDPATLSQWYRDHLGIARTADGGPWWQDAGPTVFEPFASDTDYFGRDDQAFMVNFRVPDLDAMLEQLRAAGVPVDDGIQEMDGIGRFSWGTDPEGNRFELWEPAPAALQRP